MLGIIIAAYDAPAETTAITRERLLAHPTDGWLTNGGNLFNQRYSPLTDINRDNVARLKGVWYVHLNGSGVGPPYSGEAQPIVHDGVMYVVTGAADVFAIEIASGKILWSYESGLDPAMSTGQDGVGLHPRSHHGQTTPRYRGARRRTGAAPVHVRDPAVPRW